LLSFSPVGPEFDEQRPNWPRRETVGSAASVPSMARPGVSGTAIAEKPRFFGPFEIERIRRKTYILIGG